MVLQAAAKELEYLYCCSGGLSEETNLEPSTRGLRWAIVVYDVGYKDQRPWAAPGGSVLPAGFAYLESLPQLSWNNPSWTPGFSLSSATFHPRFHSGVPLGSDVAVRSSYHPVRKLFPVSQGTNAAHTQHQVKHKHTQTNMHVHPFSSRQPAAISTTK